MTVDYYCYTYTHTHTVPNIGWLTDTDSGFFGARHFIPVYEKKEVEAF